MVEAGMGCGAPEQVAVAVAGALEGDDEIEGPPAGEAAGHGDGGRRWVARRGAHRALWRVRREDLDYALRVLGIAQQRVDRLDRRDPLKVAVFPGVVVRPWDGRGDFVVGPVAGGIGLG